MPEHEQLPFSSRIGARLPSGELWESVPDYLLEPLLDWLETELRDWSAKRIALRLRLSVPISDSLTRATRAALEERVRS